MYAYLTSDEAPVLSHLDEFSSDERASFPKELHTRQPSRPRKPTSQAILSRRLDGWGHHDLPNGLDAWARRGAQRPKAPPWPLLIERAGWQLTIRRLPVPGDADAVALLVAETRVPRSLEVLARLGLTQRQAQVLELARTGSTNAQIAGQLSITINTVETRRRIWPAGGVQPCRS